jgi:hypothetical protein
VNTAQLGNYCRSGSKVSFKLLTPAPKRQDVAVEVEAVVRVVAVLELHQTLPVLRRVGGARPLWIPVAQDEKVDEGGTLSLSDLS